MAAGATVATRLEAGLTIGVEGTQAAAGGRREAGASGHKRVTEEARVGTVVAVVDGGGGEGGGEGEGVAVVAATLM